MSHACSVLFVVIVGWLATCCLLGALVGIRALIVDSWNGRR